MAASRKPRLANAGTLCHVVWSAESNQVKQDSTRELPVTIRSALQADAEIVARIYIDSWNAGFGELLSRANRTVLADSI